MRKSPEKAQQRGCGTPLYNLHSFLWLCNAFRVKLSGKFFLDRKRSLLTHRSLNSNPVGYQLGDLRTASSPNWPSLPMPGKWACPPPHRWCEWRRNPHSLYPIGRRQSHQLVAAVRESDPIGRMRWATGSGVSLPGWVALGRILGLSGAGLPHVFSGDPEML